MDAKILEIFHSIQGEGPYAGAAQVFVRLFECNMHCVWCDTPASIGDGKKIFKTMNLEAVLKEITALDSHAQAVSITGGEPLIQADFVKELSRALKNIKKTTYLDTNGTLPDQLSTVIDYIDIIAMDLKLPSSTKQRAYWKEHEAFLKIAARKEVFIKVVVSLETLESEINQAAELIAMIDPGILFILQPNYFDMKNGIIEACVGHQKLCTKILKNVRILPQVHKFMKIR